LLTGNNEPSLAYFQSAVQTDPNYVYGVEQLRTGVWSYLGRAQYLNGKFAEARTSLERALSEKTDDNVARLYLGMTLVRLSDRQGGLKNIESGMRGISDYIGYVNNTFSTSWGRYWDLPGTIRSGIQSDLAMITSGKIDWERLLADGEALGKKMEQEREDVRRQEQDELDRKFGRDMR
jgi:tetratricopeptide (TPR) repeat protein